MTSEIQRTFATVEAYIEYLWIRENTPGHDAFRTYWDKLEPYTKHKIVDWAMANAGKRGISIENCRYS